MQTFEGIRYLIRLDSAEILLNRAGVTVSSGEVDMEVDTT